MPERGIGHRRLKLGVVDPVQFEREEQEMHRDRGDAFLHIAIEFRARGVDRVAGMDQPGERNEPAQQVVERLIGFHPFGERRAGIRPVHEFGELTFVARLERDAVGISAIEVAPHLRIVDPGIQVGQVPLR